MVRMSQPAAQRVDIASLWNCFNFSLTFPFSLPRSKKCTKNFTESCKKCEGSQTHSTLCVSSAIIADWRYMLLRTYTHKSIVESINNGWERDTIWWRRKDFPHFFLYIINCCLLRLIATDRAWNLLTRWTDNRQHVGDETFVAATGEFAKKKETTIIYSNCL